MKSLKLLEDIVLDQFDNFSEKKSGLERDINFLVSSFCCNLIIYFTN